LIHSQWLTILHRWDLSASLGEKIMLMEEFTYMLSQCGNRNSAHETLENSMYADTIQTWSLVMVLQRRVGTMRRKMETLWAEGLSDRAEADWVKLLQSGARSSLLNLLSSFGMLLHAWTHVRFAAASSRSRSLLPGSTDPTLPSMRHRQEYRSTQANWLDYHNGLTAICQEEI
jgi:hypothetical protein